MVCPDGPALTAAEVQGLLTATAGLLDSQRMTAAVVDRAGRVLGVYRKVNAPTGQDEDAVGLARTAAFFSNDQAPLSSRTVRFISGIHFPPGIPNTPNAALYGIENTNRGCDLNVPFLPGQELPPAASVFGGPCHAGATAGCGTGPVTGKADRFDSQTDAVNPGGIPVFRGAALVGAIGVAGVSGPEAEFAAFQAASTQQGLAPVPQPLPRPGVVFIDGVRLPFVEQVRRPPGSAPGNPADGAVVNGPVDGGCVPEDYLAGPTTGSVLAAAEVAQIVEQARQTASRTRALIRLPIGERTRMAFAVSDLDGTLLALFRMPDATVFSVDVAAAKARNVVYFSDPASNASRDLPGVPPGTAVTNRAIGFGSQPLFPPGIDGAGLGPFFSLFEFDTANPCSQGSQPSDPNQNGVVFFPGSIPLWKNGRLAGGLGVSGDGVEQDDYVSYGGAAGFRPPEDAWVDRTFVQGVRLPFLKFPRNPER